MEVWIKALEFHHRSIAKTHKKKSMLEKKTKIYKNNLQIFHKRTAALVTMYQQKKGMDNFIKNQHSF